jgi:hypothetical protein
MTGAFVHLIPHRGTSAGTPPARSVANPPSAGQFPLLPPHAPFPGFLSISRDTPPWPRHGTPSPAPFGVAPLLALILLLLLPHPCPASLLQTGIALWEDTADPVSFLREGHGRAPDDHLTVSLAAWADWTGGPDPGACAWNTM